MLAIGQRHAEMVAHALPQTEVRRRTQRQRHVLTHAQYIGPGKQRMGKVGRGKRSVHSGWVDKDIH
jgi:hypothetical protein